MKKGTLQKVMEIFLLTIVGLLVLGWFFGESGLGPDLLDKLSTIYLEQKPIEGGYSSSTGQGIVTWFGSLSNKFYVASSSNEDDCFVEYKRLPGDLEKFEITLTQNANDIFMALSVDGNNLYSENIEDTQLCVVDEAYAQNFHSTYFLTTDKSPVYREIDEIKFDEKKRFIISDLKGMVIDGDYHEFYHTYVFKPRDGYLCLLPADSYELCEYRDGSVSLGCDFSVLPRC